MKLYNINGTKIMICDNCENNVSIPCLKRDYNKYYDKENTWHPPHCNRYKLCQVCNVIWQKQLCETCLFIKYSNEFKCVICHNLYKIPCLEEGCHALSKHPTHYCEKCLNNSKIKLCPKCR